VFDATSLQAPAAARAFVANTFATIERGSVAAMAAAFTFGREDVIPDIFRELVRDLNQRNDGSLSKFVWYLERHIEVDGEDHGPLSLRMVADLCGDDETLWEEAAAAAESAIAARLTLWDGIYAAIHATA
jgi:pyrroloquinoline quinone (PQQ) biosynthesis protein C